MPSIDLNCDIGESYGAWSMGQDARVMPWITSANIACGFHAGDFSTMQQTVALARQHGVPIVISSVPETGAHTWYSTSSWA